MRAQQLTHWSDEFCAIVVVVSISGAPAPDSLNTPAPFATRWLQVYRVHKNAARLRLPSRHTVRAETRGVMSIRHLPGLQLCGWQSSTVTRDESVAPPRNRGEVAASCSAAWGAPVGCGQGIVGRREYTERTEASRHYPYPFAEGRRMLGSRGADCSRPGSSFTSSMDAGSDR